MKHWRIILFIMLAACQQPVQQMEGKERPVNLLKGNWQFLDKFGNYNEAYFGDSVYQTFNRYVDRNVLVNYLLRGDSLHSILGGGSETRIIRAGLTWLDNDHVVISIGSVSDTLIRLKDSGLTLQNTDPIGDSLVFLPAFSQRHVDFLVSKGIITEQEARAFLERKEVHDARKPER